MREKIKGGRLDDMQSVFTAIIIVLVGIAGFGAGRLSKIISVREPVRIEGYTISPDGIPQSLSGVASIAGTGMVIGSKNGSTYHLPWCSGASTIKPENRIMFKNEEEARGAGYRPAKNCRGLTSD